MNKICVEKGTDTSENILFNAKYTLKKNNLTNFNQLR